MSFPHRAVLIAAALLVSAVPVALAEQGGDDDRRDGRGRQSPSPVPIGEFAVDRAQGRVQGEYVSFSYNATGLQAFTAGGVPLFDLIAEGGLSGVDDRRSQGAQLRLRADGLDLQVHDNPGAVTKIRAERAVTLAFVEGTEVRATKPGELVSFAVGGLAGKVRGEELRVEGREVRGEGEILVLLDSLRDAKFEHSRPHIVRAIERGHIGVEASFNRADDGLEQDVVSYENVTLTTLRADPGNLTLLVEGHGFDGRVVVLNVDGRVVGAAKADDLRILFDNETIERADGLADVLDPDDDGLRAEYYVVFDPLGEAFQLVVSVPHYSVHTLSVTSVIPLPPPSVVVGVLAGVALLVPSAMLLFRKRRE